MVKNGKLFLKEVKRVGRVKLPTCKKG